MGFAENLVGDVTEIGKGLGILGGTFAKDVIGEQLSLASKLPGIPDYEHESTIDELAKAAPRAIYEDYKRRYGSGWKEFARGLYEDPLAFVGDVATVATVGGYGAARGAQAAARVPSVADDLARLATTGAASRTARTVDRILPGLKYQKAGITTPAGEAFPAGGLRTFVTQEGKPIEQAAAFGPSRRVFEGLRHRARTQNVTELEKRAGVIDELLAGEPSAPTPLAAERARIETVLNSARETGATRILKPRTSTNRAEKLSRKIIAEQGAHFVGQRSQAIQNYVRPLVPAIEKHGETVVMESFVGIRPVASAPRASFDEVVSVLNDPGFVADSRGQQISDAVTPLLERVQDFTDPLDVDATKRLVEIVAGEPIGTMRVGMTDELVDAMDNVRLVNMSQEAEAMLETGFTPRELFEHLYEPMRVKHALDNDIPVEAAPDAFYFDDAARANRIKAPVYYPQPAKLKQRLSDYLMKSRSGGAVRAATPSSTRKYQGRNLEAYMKGTSDAFETNPVEAYSRLAAEWTGFRNMLKLMDRLKSEFGVRVADRALVPQGWEIINPKLNRILLRKNFDIREEITRTIAQGGDDVTAFSKAIKEVFSDERMAKEIGELLDSSGDVFAVPKVVAQELNRQASSHLPDKWQVRLRLSHDPLMNAWRTTTLYLRPGYYINNVFGNTTFLKLQGASVIRLVKQLNKKFQKRLKNTIERSGARASVEGGFYDVASQRSTHLGKAAETKVGQVMTKVAESKVGRLASRGAEKGRRINSTFENAARREAFLTAAEKDLARRGVLRWHSKWANQEKRLDTILEYGVSNPQAVRRWVDEMDDVMNNYHALGPFERKVVRRFIAPFYPFYKHAFRTIVKLPFSHPAKARVLDWVHEVGKEMDTLGERPEWLEDFIHTGPGALPGTERFLSTRGANPFAGVFESPLTLLSPAGQIGYEQVTGRDVFTNRPFTAKDVYNDPITGKQFRINPETGQAEEIERRFGGLLAGVAPSALENLLGLVAPADLYRDITAEGARYSATGETIRTETGEPQFPSDPLQQLLKYAGVSTLDYNLTEYQRKQKEAKERALSALQSRLLAP